MILFCWGFLVTCLNETLFIQSFFAVTCLNFVWFALYTILHLNTVFCNFATRWITSNGVLFSTLSFRSLFKKLPHNYFYCKFHQLISFSLDGLPLSCQFHFFLKFCPFLINWLLFFMPLLRHILTLCTLSSPAYVTENISQYVFSQRFYIICCYYSIVRRIRSSITWPLEISIFMLSSENMTEVFCHENSSQTSKSFVAMSLSTLLLCFLRCDFIFCLCTYIFMWYLKFF